MEEVHDIYPHPAATRPSYWPSSRRKPSLRAMRSHGIMAPWDIGCRPAEGTASGEYRRRGEVMQASQVYTSIGLGLLGLVGWLDYLTGPEVSFSVFYCLSVAFVGWYSNRKVAI